MVVVGFGDLDEGFSRHWMSNMEFNREAVCRLLTRRTSVTTAKELVSIVIFVDEMTTRLVIENEEQPKLTDFLRENK